MNVPGRAAGNWCWRFREDMLSQSSFEWLRNLTEASMRSGTAMNIQQAHSESHASAQAVRY